MTRKLDVAIGPRGDPILTANGLLDRARPHLAKFIRGDRLIVVSDPNVWTAQGPRLNSGMVIDPIVVPAGESSKSWPTLERLTAELAECGVERGDHIVAFGGGVVGDLAGFAAAIFKRGIGVVQVPTSLLAMVDSAVGGKTGINSTAGKNSIGAFHQPSLVLIDPSCLDTLPVRELRAGYAEVLKYGLIGDANFFSWCEINGADLLAGDPAARLHAVRKCVAAKLEVVVADERDTTGKRALLNLGHTFAHAFEAEAGMSDALLHGEAVAVGLALAFRLSVARGHCPPEDAERVEAHLISAGLPIRPAQAGITATGAILTARMRADKKATGGNLPLILVRGIGQAYVDRDVSLEEVARFLDHIADG